MKKGVSLTREQKIKCGEVLGKIIDAMRNNKKYEIWFSFGQELAHKNEWLIIAETREEEHELIEEIKKKYGPQAEVYEIFEGRPCLYYEKATSIGPSMAISTLEDLLKGYGASLGDFGREPGKWLKVAQRIREEGARLAKEAISANK